MSSLTSAIQKVDAFLHTQMAKEYLRERVVFRAGLEAELFVSRYTDSAFILDPLEDKVVARIISTKAEVAGQIVRDLLCVTAIMEALRALWTEPEWSPYP